MQMRRCQPSETLKFKDWIAIHHYLQMCPPGFVNIYEFMEGKQTIGGMLIGRPCAKQYDPEKILQLHRMVFIDDTAHCVESQALAMMRKHVRVWIPKIRGLLSYSDPSVGHEGIVYEADGWCPLGLTDEGWGKGWDSREGRDGEKKSKKMRWFRTP